MNSFKHVVGMFDRLPPDLWGALLIRPWIKAFESLPKENQRPYYKVPLFGNEGKKRLVMIYWAPNSGGVLNGTMPHSHGGSSVKVRVLWGILRQDVFSIHTKAGRRRINSTEKYYTSYALRLKNREFAEKPHIIHAVSNAVQGRWSVSLHEFDARFLMTVYDLHRNLKWIVGGDEDTLGAPPSDVASIWDENGRVTIGPSS